MHINIDLYYWGSIRRLDPFFSKLIRVSLIVGSLRRYFLILKSQRNRNLSSKSLSIWLTCNFLQLDNISHFNSISLHTIFSPWVLQHFTLFTKWKMSIMHSLLLPFQVSLGTHLFESALLSAGGGQGWHLARKKDYHYFWYGTFPSSQLLCQNQFKNSKSGFTGNILKSYLKLLKRNDCTCFFFLILQDWYS